MNAQFYKDLIDDYVYYWSLKKKLIADIKSKGIRYETINGNGVRVEKANESVQQVKQIRWVTDIQQQMRATIPQAQATDRQETRVTVIHHLQCNKAADR